MLYNYTLRSSLQAQNLRIGFASRWSKDQIVFLDCIYFMCIAFEASFNGKGGEGGVRGPNFKSVLTF